MATNDDKTQTHVTLSNGTMVLLAVLLIIGSVLTSCGTNRGGTLLLYEHPKGTRLAEFSISRIITSAVRDRHLEMKLNGFKFIPRDTLEIAPGKHMLVLGWKSDPLTMDSRNRMVSYPWSPYWVQFLSLSFSAKAGHVYELRPDTTSREWAVDLIDHRDSAFIVHGVSHGSQRTF